MMSKQKWVWDFADLLEEEGFCHDDAISVAGKTYDRLGHLEPDDALD